MIQSQQGAGMGDAFAKRSVQADAWLVFTISRYKKDNSKQLREGLLRVLRVFPSNVYCHSIPSERDKMAKMFVCLVVL